MTNKNHEDLPLNNDDSINDEVTQKTTDEKELIGLWRNRLAGALKVYEPYYEVIKRARKFYKSGAKEDVSSFQGKQPAGGVLFWSGIETQKPFLYFKQPKPYLERLSKHTSAIEQVAAKILERALEWNLTQFDFDSVIKYARNDYLIFGTGILWEAYEPEFQSVQLAGIQGNIELKTGEKVVTKYIDPLDFVADISQNGIFENVTWIARCIHMNQVKIISSFGEEMWEKLVEKGIAPVTDADDFVLDVYEIWDKEERKVYWFSFELDEFLLQKEDPLRLSSFFPMPKPIFATMTNDSLIPISDFQMIEKMLVELTFVTERMQQLLEAMKVSGVYDASFSRLADIFDKDVTLVGLHDFERLKEAGGIKGAIDFIPIEQYIQALEILVKRKEALKQEIFEMTGVSDIMRGNSTKVETATAVEKKTNFGTLRNQDRQNDMHRFIMGCYRLKAELICEQFSAETLEKFISETEGYSTQTVKEAVQLLKNNKMRDMIVNIETEAFFNQEKQTEKTIFAIETISKMLSNGVAVVAQEPLLLPLYRQMITSLTGTLVGARHFENVIDQTFRRIEQAFKKKEQTSDLMQASMLMKQNNMQKSEIDDLKYHIEKQELFLKLKDLVFKERELNFKNKKAELDFQKALIRSKQEGAYQPTVVPVAQPVLPPKPVVLNARRLARQMSDETPVSRPFHVKRALFKKKKIDLNPLKTAQSKLLPHPELKRKKETA